MVLKAVSGLAGGALLPAGLVLPALAADHPALGTYPAGSSGDSVFVGVSVPRTGTYAAAGEDLIKGYELALEHLNAGHELMHKMSPNIKKRDRKSTRLNSSNQCTTRMPSSDLNKKNN